MNEIKSDRKALQEKINLYESKRLERIKAIPETEGMMADLDSLKPQVVEVQQQLKCIEVLQKAASHQ